MRNKDEHDRIGYALALGDVEFDPLPMGPRKPVDTRDWVFESQAAEILGITKRALERRRQRGTGPLHHQRISRTCYYVDDLDAWVASKPKAYTPPPNYGE
ncbi:MAG: hypothetical protein QM608_08710 [Caulobacter sp.]